MVKKIIKKQNISIILFVIASLIIVGILINSPFSIVSSYNPSGCSSTKKAIIIDRYSLPTNEINMLKDLCYNVDYAKNDFSGINWNSYNLIVVRSISSSYMGDAPDEVSPTTLKSKPLLFMDAEIGDSSSNLGWVSSVASISSSGIIKMNKIQDHSIISGITFPIEAPLGSQITNIREKYFLVPATKIASLSNHADYITLFIIETGNKAVWFDDNFVSTTPNLFKNSVIWLAGQGTKTQNPPDNPPCTPTTCVSLGKQCGTWGDNCEGNLDCGTCQTGYDCNNGICVEIQPSQTCGNNIIEGTEVCDGDSLGNKGCQDYGFDSGELLCKSDCSGYDINLCENTQQVSCIPSWNCANWSECINSLQARNCIDNNNCGIIEGKPSELRQCTVSNIPIEDPKNYESLVTPTTSEFQYVLPECNSGDEKCIGEKYYKCENDDWKNKGSINNKCGYIEPCKEGNKICQGNSAYECINGEYLLNEVCQAGCSEGECASKYSLSQLLIFITIFILVAIIIWVGGKK